jgi:hypothetical protein
MRHDVRVYPQIGSDRFFAACVTDNGSCHFESKGDFDHVSSETRTHYRRVGQ